MTSAKNFSVSSLSLSQNSRRRRANKRVLLGDGQGRIMRPQVLALEERVVMTTIYGVNSFTALQTDLGKAVPGDVLDIDNSFAWTAGVTVSTANLTLVSVPSGQDFTMSTTGSSFLTIAAPGTTINNLSFKGTTGATSVDIDVTSGSLSLNGGTLSGAGTGLVAAPGTTVNNAGGTTFSGDTNGQLVDAGAIVTDNGVNYSNLTEGVKTNGAYSAVYTAYSGISDTAITIQPGAGTTTVNYDKFLSDVGKASSISAISALSPMEATGVMTVENSTFSADGDGTAQTSPWVVDVNDTGITLDVLGNTFTGNNAGCFNTFTSTTGTAYVYDNLFSGNKEVSTIYSPPVVGAEGGNYSFVGNTATNNSTGSQIISIAPYSPSSPAFNAWVEQSYIGDNSTGTQNVQTGGGSLVFTLRPGDVGQCYADEVTGNTNYDGWGCGVVINTMNAGSGGAFDAGIFDCTITQNTATFNGEVGGYGAGVYFNETWGQNYTLAILSTDDTNNSSPFAEDLYAYNEDGTATISAAKGDYINYIDAYVTGGLPAGNVFPNGNPLLAAPASYSGNPFTVAKPLSQAPQAGSPLFGHGDNVQPDDMNGVAYGSKDATGADAGETSGQVVPAASPSTTVFDVDGASNALVTQQSTAAAASNNAVSVSLASSAPTASTTAKNTGAKVQKVPYVPAVIPTAGAKISLLSRSGSPVRQTVSLAAAN